jgi:hypothetical protein
MAESLPSPPESRSSTPEETSNTDALTARLDELLEQYLESLDRYMTLREELSKSFSSGFFSLAQAQRTSTLGAGRRYGEECYDDRMKAQRKVSWSPGSTKGDSKCRIAKDKEDRASKSETEGTKQIPANDAQSKELDGDKSIEQQDKEEKDKSDSQDAPSKTARPKQDPAKRDPLTWFGVLVPPALRQTQTQFVKATEVQIPELLVVDSKLKSIEREVWALRDQLGISSDYDQDGSETEQVVEKVTHAVQDAKLVESTMDSRLSRKSLTSRPAHSKSHLLKLGD